MMTEFLRLLNYGIRTPLTAATGWSRVLLEALRITSGDQLISGDGGGVCVLTTSLTINACRIYSKMANYGGGLFASGAEVTLLGSEILSNAAMSEGGVGIVSWSGSSR